jgi:CheY-like chemotaxis protein
MKPGGFQNGAFEVSAKPTIEPYVLMAEDQEADIFFMQRAFEKADISVPLVVTRDGQEALDYLFSRGQARRPGLPSMVILDIKMPKLTGLEVLQALRGHPEFEQVPILIFSSSGEQCDRDRAKVLGATEYHVKPMTPSDLVEWARDLRRRWLP